jgi:ABC-2 type transport system ATP-binding protein
VVVLEVQQLSRSFRTAQGVVKALEGATFTVPDGVIAGLLGPNGSGKTTLMRLVMRILPMEKGEILFDGRPIGDLDRRATGYMPEERGLYPKATIYEQLRYLLRLKGFSAEVAQREIQNWGERLGILSYIHRPAKTLSKGMQQKAQLTLALAGNPRFLLLDEPFSGLDPINSQEVEQLLRSLREPGRLILLSTHRLEQVDELCDYIVLIHRGRILLAGHTAKLKRQYWDQRYFIETEAPVASLRWPEGASWHALSAHSAEVVLSHALSSQALLQGILTQTAARVFYEKLPTVKEIFLRAVQSHNL